MIQKRKIEPEAINPLSGSINYILDLTLMAKRNRHSSTIAEDKIWHEVLRFRKTGYKFTRQKPINRFILDFYCSELNLAIEVDGGYHLTKTETDKMRDKFLAQIGIVTIRFTNQEIIQNIQLVKNKINQYCLSLALSRGGDPDVNRDRRG